VTACHVAPSCHFIPWLKLAGCLASDYSNCLCCWQSFFSPPQKIWSVELYSGEYLQERVNVKIIYDSRNFCGIYNTKSGYCANYVMIAHVLTWLWTYECASFECMKRCCVPIITYNGNSCYIKWNTRCDMLLVLTIGSVSECGVSMPVCPHRVGYVDLFYHTEILH
jgi:hypothetical protein